MTNKLSIFAYTIVCFALIFSLAYYKKSHKHIIDGGDTFGYFTYLPAVLIHKDLHNFRKCYAAKEEAAGRVMAADQRAFYNAFQLPDDKTINKYTCGVAVMASPFYLLAHWLSPVFAYEQTGFTPLYIWSFLIAGLFYVLLGLWTLRKTLLRYFSDKAVAITLILLALATNLYYFSSYESGMSHSFLFFLYVQLIAATLNFYDSPNFKSGILIGLCAGAITAIRPTEVICLFIPLFYGIVKWSDFKQNFNFWIENWQKILIAILFFMLAGVPQMAYWKFLTGKFLYYSYQDESFDFKHPRIIDGIFSFQNGWLAYSPIMGLAILGVFLLKDAKKWRLPILTFLPVHIYIIYSWWCWNYINGIGSRPMIEAYPLLAFGMAAFWEFILTKKWLKFPLLAIGILAIYLFQMLTWQVSKGLFWTEIANSSFYIHMIGKTKMDWRGAVMFDTKEWQPDTADMRLKKVLFKESFEDSLHQSYTKKAWNPSYCYRLAQKEEFFNLFATKNITETGIEKDDYLKVELRFMREYSGQDFYKNSVLNVQCLDKNGKNIKTVQVRIDNKSNKDHATIWGWESLIWTKLFFFVKMGRKYDKLGEVKAYVWNPTNNPIFFDDCEVSLWKKK